MTKTEIAGETEIMPKRTQLKIATFCTGYMFAVTTIVTSLGMMRFIPFVFWFSIFCIIVFGIAFLYYLVLFRKECSKGR